MTNGEVGDPFAVFDTYDWRSVIENGIFKEGKHPWHLLCFPKRTEAAVGVYCHFTLLVMALCTAFRLWQAQLAATPTSSPEVLPTLRSTLLGGEGTARWRQRLREANRDKIIVFLGQTYGIFHLAEFAVLTHVPIRRLPSPLALLRLFFSILESAPNPYVKTSEFLLTFLLRRKKCGRIEVRERAPICLFLPTGTASALPCSCLLPARPPNIPSVDLTRSQGYHIGHLPFQRPHQTP